MAHELDFTEAGVARLFSYRQVAWHGLGNVVDTAPNSLEALKLAGLDWDVLAEDVYLKDGVLIPNLKANIRSTDRKVLGTRSDRYTILQNRDAFAFTDAWLGEGAVYETAGAIYGGTQIFLTAKLPEPITLLGDKIAQYIAVTTTHDGSGSVTAAAVNTRIVCKNTLNIALKNAARTWKGRHTGDMTDKIAEAHRILGLAETYGLALKFYAEAANEVVLNKPVVDKFLSDLFGDAKKAEGRSKTIIENKIDDLGFRLWKAPDLANFRDNSRKTVTKWALVNAITDFAQHTDVTRQTSSFKDSRLASTIGGDNFVDNALQLVNAL